MRSLLKKKLFIGFVLLFAVVAAAAYYFKGPLIRLAGWPFIPEMDPPAAGVMRFAAIGDYGSAELQEGDVARLIKSWKPEFIITLGDNNYPSGAAETIDQNIGQFFHDYIHPYGGKFGKGGPENRFFPIPGHRDWDTGQLQPYLDYFVLPANERYYDFIKGPVHFFMIDTDEREPDGATQDSIQADWLKQRMSESSSIWKVVCAHHAPFTSHDVDDIYRMRWPFKEWGADAVLSGFFHIYERLYVDGLTYIVNGAGGSWVSGFGDIDPNSRVRYNDDYGALMVEASDKFISFRFINRKGILVDAYTIENER